MNPLNSCFTKIHLAPSAITTLKQLVLNALFNWVMISLALLVFSCSSDELTLTITTQPTTLSFSDLNTCDVGAGGLATRFQFTIPYQASEGIEIEKITTDWERFGGNSGINQVTNFNDTGTSIMYSWCWRFDGDDWIDLTARLTTKQGVTSNPSTVRVNKPEGAN